MGLQRGVRAVIVALGIFGLVLAALSQVRETRHEKGLYSDEPEWIAISILHWQQFALGAPPAGAELDPPEEQYGTPWRRGVQRTTFGYMNPCLPKLVWGAVLHAGGFREASPLAFEVFGRGQMGQLRAAREAMLPAMGLTRRVVLVLCALGVALFVLALRELRAGAGGWGLAALAGVLLVASPLVRNTASYIRTDWFMVVPGLAALHAAMVWRAVLGGGRGRARQLGAAAVLGLLSGLAVSSKLSGAMVGLCVALWFLLAWFDRREERSLAGFLRGPLCASVLAGVVCALVFWVLNPRLWSGPVEGVRDILARWDQLLGFFQDVYAPRLGVEVAHSLPERLALFADRTLGRDDAWRALTGLPGGGLLALVGAGALLWEARRLGGGEARALPAALALGFCCVTLPATALWIPVDWERFFLTAAPAMALLQAAALWTAGAFVARRVGLARARGGVEGAAHGAQ